MYNVKNELARYQANKIQYLAGYPAGWISSAPLVKMKQNNTGFPWKSGCLALIHAGFLCR